MKVHSISTSGYGDYNYSYTYNLKYRNTTSFKSIYNPNSVLHKFNPLIRFLDNYFQRSLSASRYMWIKPNKTLSPHLKVVDVELNNGLKNIMWDINNNNKDKYLVVLHGLSHNISSLQDLYTDVISKTDFAVIAPEYYGFEKNNNDKVYLDPVKLLRDVKESIKYLDKKGIKHENIYVLGHSFGGYVASLLAKKYPDLRGLILVSSTNSNSHNAKRIEQNKIRHTPKIIKEIVEESKIARSMLSLFFNTGKVLNRVKVPVDIIHSKWDKLIDLKTSEKLAHHCKHLNSFNIVDGYHRMDNNKINKIVEILNNENHIDLKI